MDNQKENIVIYSNYKISFCSTDNYLIIMAIHQNTQDSYILINNKDSLIQINKNFQQFNSISLRFLKL